MATLEQKAIEFENRIEALVKKAEALEDDQKQNILFKQELLVELDKLKKFMKNDKKEVDTVYLKLKEAQEENENLKQENTKLKYRIEHLVKNCFEPDDKQA